ncbi:MAG: glycosyltransferase family 2 protein [Pseudomonadota bacterium]
MARIAVIMVNYNAAQLAISGIESVLKHDHPGHVVDIHVLDNASPLGDADVLQSAAEKSCWGDRVTLYRQTENLGFGRGNNHVISALLERDEKPEFVFLLNPDAALENEAIAILADFMDANPSVAVAGARIESPEGDAVTAAFNFPSTISEFSSGVAFGPIDRLLARWRVPLSPDLPRRQVDWVAGAAMIARVKALRQVNFFDPAYFLYYEEVDMMRRLKLAGWQTWFVPEAIAVHEEGRSTGVKSGESERRRLPLYLYESWRIYYLSQFGRASAIFTACCRVLGISLGHVIFSVRGRRPSAPLMFYRDFYGIVIRPLLGLKAKHYD